MNIFGFEVSDQTAMMVVFAILGVAVVLFLKSRKKEDSYEKKDIDKEGPKAFSEYMKDTGAKTFDCKYMLFNGPIKLGRITSFSPISWDSKIATYANLSANKEKKMVDEKITELKKLADQVKGVTIDHNAVLIDNFYLFEVIKDTPIHKILYILGIGKIYHLVDQEYTERGYHEYNINLYARPKQEFKNVYIYSEKSKALALNITDRLTVHQLANGVVNYIPKMEFVEMKTANYAAKARENLENKETSWQRRDKNLHAEPGDNPA